MGEQTRITSLDVARMAGVSQSAVSRVFSGASASKATIAKVRAAADTLGYRPNAMARAMITGKSRIIGLLVAYLDNQFYPEALERLSKRLKDEGYHILVFMAANGRDAVDSTVRELMDYQVDGIIAASVSIGSELTDRCEAAGIPVVLFNRGQDDATFSQITSDNLGGGRKAAEFLIAGGHERIAHISGWEGSSTGRDRALGFRLALDAAGLTPGPVICGMFDRTVAAQAARTMMDSATPPDAIFVGNDHMAFAVMDTLRAMGLRVPQDVSVVGYDDVPMASWGGYDLTTIRQPVNRMVDATVETLVGQINDPERPPQKTEIGGSLILRSSARATKGTLP